jgi:hypothetical protein
MQVLIPLLGLIEELTPSLNLHKDQSSVFWKACGYEPDSEKLIVDLYEDNAAAYALAEAPKMQPRTNHITLKYRHFREHISNGTVRIADIIFSKALDIPPFTHLCKLLVDGERLHHTREYLNMLLQDL